MTPPSYFAVLDYDGTITAQECVAVVLQELVGDAWLNFEDELLAGRMSHADALRREVELLPVSSQEFVTALVARATPRAGLRAFFSELAARGGRGLVVSAGFRAAIEEFWRREALPPIELLASELVSADEHGRPPLGVTFNSELGDCPTCGRASCKAAVIRARQQSGELVLVFGDGVSDLCMARTADLTFARDELAKRCAREGLEWLPLDDFVTVWPQVDAWRASHVS